MGDDRDGPRRNAGLGDEPPPHSVTTIKRVHDVSDAPLREAIRYLRIRPATREDAYQAKSAVRKYLYDCLSAFIPEREILIHEMDRVEDEILPTLNMLVDRPHHREDVIIEDIKNVVEAAVLDHEFEAFYSISQEEETDSLIAKNLDDSSPSDKLYTYLYTRVVNLLEKELIGLGIGEANSAKIARSIMDDFQSFDGGRIYLFQDPVYTSAAVGLVTSTVRALGPAAVAFGQVGSAGMPKQAPERWADRDPAEFPTAESFLRHHYGPRLGIDGDLTQAELGRIDMALQTALTRQFKGRREELRALLPTVEERNDALLLREHGFVPQDGERKRRLTALSKKRKPSP